MQDYRFWKDWNPQLRVPYLLLLALTLCAAGIGVYHYLTGFDTVVRWERVPSLQPVDATLHQFQALLQPFTIPVNGYVITEKYDASMPYLNLTAAVLHLSLIALCLVFYVATISTFRRVAYLAGMLLLMLYLATFNFDLLGIFGETNKFLLILILVVLGGVSYAFQAFFTETGFLMRLLAVAAAVAALGAFVFLQSPLPAEVTALHLVNYSATGSLIAAILFIILVAYENIHALLWVNSQAANPRRRFGLWQFMLICLLYLLNLLLLYFKHGYIFDINVFYIDAFIILMFSMVAGFWGFRQREKHYQRFFSFYPGGAYIYLVFAAITVLAIGYAFATANEPMIGAFTDIIIFTHLAYGLVFFIYIIINFRPLISERLRVYRVVYDPRRLPFYTVYIMGSLALLVLVMRARLYTYNQIMSGYYNYLGDLHRAQQDDLLAEQFYQEGAIWEHHNVKSNYALAAMAREKNFRDTEINYLKECLLEEPDPKIFARLANMYSEKEYFFEQLYVLKNATDSFPRNSQLYNNLALLYNQTSLIDSVGYYLSLARQLDNNETVKSNELAFFIRNGLARQAIERLPDAQRSDYVPLKSNAMLLRKLSEEPPGKEKPELPAGRVLTPETFSLFYHTVLFNLSNPDPVWVKRINSYLALRENALYDEDLTLLKAAVQRALGQKATAKKTLEQLAAVSENTDAYYYDIIGLWLMEDGLYPAAAAYFDRSKNKGYPPAFLHHGYALALAGRTAEAQQENQKVFVSDDPELVLGAHQLSNLLNLTPEQAPLAPDSMKVQYLKIHSSTIAPALAATVAGSVQKPELKPVAQLELAKIYLERNEQQAAQQTLNTLLPALKEENQLLSEANLLQFDLWLATGNYADLKKTLQKRFLTPEHAKRRAYYAGMLAQAEKDNAAARKNFDELVRRQPFFEAGIIAAANFYTKNLGDAMKAYDLLQEGITNNRFSAPLYKAYILHSQQMGFETYAESGLQELQRLVSPAEYATFNSLYQERRRQLQAAAENW